MPRPANGFNAGDHIHKMLDNSSAMVVIPLTEEQKVSATRVVCGSPMVKDATDASTILQALGLIPYKENEHGS